MSEQTIYSALRAGGLSPAGACGMMGNMYAESVMRSDNVQDNCTMSDFDYTYAVDNGIITRWQFMSDEYGYGLCQWTLSNRKDGLYMLAREKGVSISDEAMQCEYCIYELSQVAEYKNLYAYLCSTDDLVEATKRICAEYERPRINNYAERINPATMFYNQFASETDVSCEEDACPIEHEQIHVDTCDVTVRVLKKGDLGRDVYLMQCGLFDMGYDCGIPDGDFGNNTENAVKQLQGENEMIQSGIADWFVWQTILNAR